MSYDTSLFDEVDAEIQTALDKQRRNLKRKAFIVFAVVVLITLATVVIAAYVGAKIAVGG